MPDQPVHKPPRKSSRRVYVIDRFAELFISTGGFLVVVAVLGICVYLAYVVVPLFSRGTVGEAHEVASRAPRGIPVLDQYQLGMAVVEPDGTVLGFVADSGESLGEPVELDASSPVTAVSIARNGELVATGHADGTVRLGSVAFRSSSVEVPDDRAIGERWSDGDAVYEAVTPGRARRVVLEVDMGEPVALDTGTGGVRNLEYQVDATGRTVLVAVRTDGTVLVNTVRTIRPLGGGPARTRLSSTSFSIAPDALPDRVFVTADGAHALLLDADGTLRRYVRAGDTFERAESVDAIEGDARVTAATMHFGGKTLLIGDSAGDVHAWHVATFADDETGDSGLQQLSRAHTFSGGAGAIIDITPSVRDRSIVVLSEGGSVRVRHVTSEKIAADFESGLDDAYAARLTPKNDGIFAIGDAGRYVIREFEPGYPEFSFKALFGKVHYEGQLEPSFVYQSSSGDDASEVKLSVMPLIFGSLKATAFAMLFAVPVGVLAAVYTSEFLSHRVRRVVKPGVEMMASLPSVVLGFIAAIIVAPFAREWLPSVLIGFATIPFAVLVMAHAWQLVPEQLRKRMRSGQHLMMVLASCFLGVTLAVLTGPAFERLLFAPPEGVAEGVPVDMRRWLAGEYGPGWPGWFVVLTGPVAIALAFLQSVFLSRRVDRLLAGKSGGYVSAVVFARFFAMLGLIATISLALAFLLQAMGFDPRDSIFGPFSPRNTLVVAIIMGFAVIPIIYTISEDSLRAVPDSLRAASLGAGATPWQTAMRIIIPVAGSGIFSACMIGFGRAVGETMIVLMATGNTPEMSWNIFGGFRTLAANIAVELPEAPKGETHYRVLFLCGLVLFLMTFVINTCAEIVRQVVRARTAGL